MQVCVLHTTPTLPIVLYCIVCVCVCMCVCVCVCVCERARDQATTNLAYCYPFYMHTMECMLL